MSKIGKINISIPEKVKVVLNGNILNIEGPLGKKKLNIDLDIFSLDIKDGKKISKSILIDFFPAGPSIFKILPARTTFTFSGIEIFIFPIFDIKKPYKLPLHRLFVFLLRYLS